MKIESAISLFLYSRLKSSKAKKEYGKVLKDFTLGLTWVKEISRKRVLEFHQERKTKLSEAYSAVVLAMVRSFCNFCWDNKWLPINPALTVRQRIPTYGNIKNRNLSDFIKILEQTKKTTWEGARDFLLLRCVFLLGRRKALALRWNSELPKQVQNFKKEYEEQLIKHLKETETYWQLKVEKLKLGSLFCKLDGKQLNKKDLSTLFSKYRKKAGFKADYINLESLKRMRAAQIWEATKSVEAVKDYCEHKEIKRTEAFISSLGKN